jgi:hypothetical protein
MERYLSCRSGDHIPGNGMTDAYYGMVHTIQTPIIPVVGKITGQFSPHPGPRSARGKIKDNIFYILAFGNYL